MYGIVTFYAVRRLFRLCHLVSGVPTWKSFVTVDSMCRLQGLSQNKKITYRSIVADNNLLPLGVHVFRGGGSTSIKEKVDLRMNGRVLGSET